MVTLTIVMVLSSIALAGVILGNGKEMRCECKEDSLVSTRVQLHKELQWCGIDLMPIRNELYRRT